MEHMCGGYLGGVSVCRAPVNCFLFTQAQGPDPQQVLNSGCESEPASRAQDSNGSDGHFLPPS